jgi:hypothetical protein
MVVRRTLDEFKQREKVSSIGLRSADRVSFVLVKPPEKIVPVAAAQVNGAKKPKKLGSVK